MTLVTPPVTVLDWTSHEPNPPPKLHNPDGTWRYRTTAHGVFVRDPKSIDGICVHQTACVYGPHDDTQKKHERAFNIPIHAVAFNDGSLVLPYPPLWYLFHGGGWNSRSLGIEIEGKYDDGPDQMTDLAVACARQGITELVTRGRALGCPIRHVWAHRQSAGDRRDDPGREIWKRVVLEHAVAVLGLIPQQSVHLKDGRSIPVSWDPNGIGPF